MARQNDAVIRKLANISLKLETGVAPDRAAAHTATAAFDLVLEVPASEAQARRQKLQKEKTQLEKARDSSQRQLENEEFLSKAPAAVINSIRQKVVQYDAQIAKLGQSLEHM